MVIIYSAFLFRREGGILHVHGNVKDSEECQWTDHVSKSIYEIATSEGSNFLFQKLHNFASSEGLISGVTID